MNLRSLRIAPRAALCFGTITFFLILLGAFAFEQIRELRATEQTMETDWLASVQTADDIQIALLHTRLESIRLLATTDPAAASTAKQQIQQARDIMNERTAYYRDHLISNEHEKAVFEEAAQLMKAYLEGLDQIVSLAGSDHEQALALANGNQRQRSVAYQDRLSALREANTTGAKQAGDYAAGIYQRSVWIMLTIMMLAVISTLLLAWRLTRSLAQPINASLVVANAIAAGQLTSSIHHNGGDEAAGLMRALAQMQDNLKDTIRGISSSSTRLNNAAGTMNTVTHEATQTLSRQNAEIDQAATAVTQMSAAVEEVARNAASTSESARQSCTAAVVGNDEVKKTLEAMQQLTQQVQTTSTQVEGLADQAQDIAKVLGVIGAIAEQTNLLALNAAIEAARAGEQGRGFAVVADEVRALAHRTQQSTREIEQMISAIQAGSAEAVTSMQASTAKVHETYAIAQAAGTALNDILHAVKLIEDRNTQIAAASEQQAYVAREVDRNLVSIRDLSVASEGGNKQTVDAGLQLSSLASELGTLVQKFKLA